MKNSVTHTHTDMYFLLINGLTNRNEVQVYTTDHQYTNLGYDKIRNNGEYS